MLEYRVNHCENGDVTMFQYFFETKDTIVKGVGFKLFDLTHIFWLVLLVVLAVAGCLVYRRLSEKGRKIFRIVLASLIVADELYKIVGLLAIGKYTAGYLPIAKSPTIL